MRLPSPELIMQIEQSEKDYMSDRMLAIQEREGNPEGIEMVRFGQALCLYSRTMPWPSFNTVKGMTSEDRIYLDEIIAFYRSRGRKMQFEMVPTRVDGHLLAELTRRGLYPSGFHASTYGVPSKELLSRPDHIEIRKVEEGDFRTYAAIHCRGTGLPEEGIPHVARNNRVLWRRPGWEFYIAYVSGQPAAAAVMYIRDGICSLTFAATLPEYRGQGLHQLLLNTRIARAYQQNCELVVGQCAFLSQSQRNMERAGMKLGYVRTTWTEAESN
ncbi:GNAT family N-acetyltransferase [Paenibacillus sp. 7541]|nr:GNAT family N-acetyltransferase [Paenibacillus sp. 7541]